MKSYLEREHGEGLRAAGMRPLMAAVITQAVMDVAYGKPSCGESDRAMAFILGERCRLLCLDVGIDHVALLNKTATLYRRRLMKALAIRPAKIQHKRGRLPKNGGAGT